MQLQKVNVTPQISSKYYDIDEIHYVEIPNKNKSLSLFHINACSHNRNFDDHQHLLSWAKNNCDIMRVTETRITKKLSLLNNLNPYNYSYEFTPTKNTAGGTLVYIANHLINVLMTQMSITRMNWDQLLLKLITLKNQL